MILTPQRPREPILAGLRRILVGATTVCVALAFAAAAGGPQTDDGNLIRNPAFEQLDGSGKPVGYELSGGATYQRALLDPRADAAGHGIALGSAAGGGPQPSSGAVSQTVAIDSHQGRAFCFRFRGLPQDGFTVADDGLYMAVAFSGDSGRTVYDAKRKQLYPLVQQARRDLSKNGDGRVGGAAVWRDYVLTFYVPFPQVDQLTLTVNWKRDGAPTITSNAPEAGARPSGPGRRGEPPVKRIDTAGGSFLVSDLRLTRLPEPVKSKTQEVLTVIQPAAGELLPLGGRWSYHAKPGETQAPALFDHTNAARLLYRDGPNGGYTAPFAGNVSASLHAGNKDLSGHLVTADQTVADNVTVRFEASSLVLHTHGIPNHPTGRFPEDGVGPGFNPSHIQEQDETYYLPLEPKMNPAHLVTTSDNSNRALNMGPIGVAVNGVVFFNPFDAGSMDASNIMDRCCGHPNQDGQYHYHKYPICLNSPWSDEGNAHSPLLGWAFDGFPIYGPYESANVMAKDVTGTAALNTFNLHYDEQRGWHYHVTPGAFPYLIGGYWGQVVRRNVHLPRGRGPMPWPDGRPPNGPPPW